MRKIGPPFIYNPETKQWVQIGTTDVHRVQRSTEIPLDVNVEVWIRLVTLNDGSEASVLMLKNGNGEWYSPYDKNLDGSIDYASEAGNALKLDNHAADYFATKADFNTVENTVNNVVTTSLTKITDGTTVVGKANKDSAGNVIKDTYATKEEVQLKESTTFKLQDKYVAVRTPGRTSEQYYEFWDTEGLWAPIKCGKVTADGGFVGNATSATKATQDGSGNTITSYYTTLSTAQTISGAKTFSAATKISNTTASSSTTTGALIVSGGIGCAGNIYGSKVFGAVYNDYAETRLSFEKVQPGFVVSEQGNDKVGLCKEDCAVAPMIVSDTYGFCIGEQENEEQKIYALPIGISGRVLAYVSPQSKELMVGDVVCSADDGKIRKMKWWEKIFKPECILGTVSSIPTYDVWGGDIKVDNRIWIKIK